MRRSGTLKVVVATAVVAALLGVGATVVVTAGASGTNTTYYACLQGGKLSSVGTTAPTCVAPATAISWNQTGPPGNTILSGTTAPTSKTGVAGNFYLDTKNHKLYGPATGSCLPLPCKTIWGTGTSLVGPAGPAGEGTAYQTTGSGTVTDDGYAVLSELTLPDGYFTLNATVGTPSTFTNGLYCELSVNYDNGLDGTIDTEYSADSGEISLSGSVYYDPADGTGYAVVWCGPSISNNSGEQASVTAHLTATQVSSVINQ